MERGMKQDRCALVLAGGASRRMGMRKEWLELDGEPGLLHTVRSLQNIAGKVAVVTDARQTYPFLPEGVALIRDEEPDCGPISGICSGMRGQEAETHLVTGCDYPLMRPQVWERLLARLAAANEPDAVIPRVRGRLHPLCAVYRRRTLPLWEAALEARELRVMRVLEGMRWAAYEAEGEGEEEALLNMNTPEDYTLVLERWKAREG